MNIDIDRQLVWRILIIPAFCLLTGCIADKEDIHFTSDYKLTSLATNNIDIPSAAKKLSPPEELEIERAVFVYLLQRHFGDAGEYSAVFLQADDSEVAALMKQFPDHLPPIKQSYHARLLPNRAPMDKDTDRSAMIFSLDVGDLNDDDSVDVLGKWYAGGAVSGFYTFLFKKTGEEWTIVSVK